VLLDPDAIPFRPMDTPGTIGDTEERTFALYLAMLGGVIEIGDPLVGMRPFAQDTVRRMLPAYGHTARPLDIFVRDYNERFVLPVTAWSNDANAPSPWVLLGATNWGRNRDWTTNPPTDLPDAMRHYHFARSEIGLGDGALVAWELWSGQMVPVSATGVDFDVAAHDSAAIVVRPLRAGVQLLGTDRHVTGGAPDVVAERWDATSRTFTLSLRVAAAGAGGRTTTLHVAVRADDAVTGMPTAMLSGTSAPDLTVARSGQLVTVSFTPAASATATLTLVFP
jgi:hypothetical protein